MLVIDSERGIVLRQTSLLDGDPYSVTEFTDVAIDDASAHVHVTQRAGTGRAPERTPDGLPWTTITRDGVAYRTWEPTETDALVGCQLIFELGGTEIRLISGELGRDELLAFAGTFGAARREPPSLC